MGTRFPSLVRRYIDLWNVGDDERQQAMVELLADDVVYVDPNVRARGRAELDRYIRLTRMRYRGMAFAADEPVDGHHDQVRFAWRCGPPGGEPAATGLDVALFDGDRLSALFGFFDPPPTDVP